MAAFVTRTVGDVVAEIVMSRTNFAGSFLLLEGETDSKFWSPRIDTTGCQIVIAGSKPTVIGAIIRTNALPVAGILGIVDDDYDSLSGIPLASINTLRTDYRDLETLLIKSMAFDRVIHEIGDAAKMIAFQAAEATTVRDALVERSLLFGKLRWLNGQRAWNLDFGSLSPFRFANEADWRIDEAEVLTTAADAAHLTVDELTSLLDTLPIADPYLLLHGKDTLAVLAVGLRSKLGNHQHPADRICQMLRLAFDSSMLQATQLYVDMEAWEVANTPYRIL